MADAVEMPISDRVFRLASVILAASDAVPFTRSMQTSVRDILRLRIFRFNPFSGAPVFLGPTLLLLAFVREKRLKRDQLFS